MIPFITSRTSTWRLLPPRLAGGIKVRHAPIHRRSGHSDIAICCGRNVLGSSPSTSVVPLSNQVTTLNHKRFKGFKMFSDGHLGIGVSFNRSPTAKYWVPVSTLTYEIQVPSDPERMTRLGPSPARYAATCGEK